MKLPANQVKRFLAAAWIGGALVCCLGLAGCNADRSEMDVAIDAGPGATETKTSAELKGTAAPFYIVDHYDAKRDPAEDLAVAMERASAEKKRILIQVGGDWCGWCKLMSNYMEADEAVRDHLTKNFLVMKVTYEDGQKNEAFLSKYPAISGYPHLFVVGSDGTLLHSQETGSLEEGRGYNQEKYLAFLDAWKL